MNWTAVAPVTSMPHMTLVSAVSISNPRLRLVFIIRPSEGRSLPIDSLARPRELRSLQIPKHSRQEWGIEFFRRAKLGFFRNVRTEMPVPRPARKRGLINKRYLKEKKPFPKTVCQNCATDIVSPIAAATSDGVYELEDRVHLETSPVALVCLSAIRGSLTYIGSYMSRDKKKRGMNPPPDWKTANSAAGRGAASWMFGHKGGGGWIASLRLLFPSLFQMKVATMQYPAAVFRAHRS